MRSSDGRIRSLALVGVAVALACWTLVSNWSGLPLPSTWFWLVACVLGECLWVRLPVGNATVSMASSANFAALLILPGAHAMAVVGASTWITDTFVRRKPAIRVAFNVSQSMLATAAGAYVFHALAGPLDWSVFHTYARLLPVLPASAAAYWIVNTGSVGLAIGCSEWTSPFRAWRANYGSPTDILAAGATLSLGALIAFNHAIAGPMATLIVALPLLIAYDSYRRRFPADREGREETHASEARAA